MINISAGDQQRIDDYVARFEQMNDAEARARHEEIIAKTEAEYAEFVRAFNEGDCYLCHHPIASFSTQRPCLHWLLKPKGFKKKHIVEVASHYDFFQLQSYLRWVANQQAFATNINDLSEEGTGGKLVELTIRYKNLEWSLSCGETDFRGHEHSQNANFPHYHLQMRLDGRPFIDFNDYHLRFSIQDIARFEAKRRLPDKIRHQFPFGWGMSDVINESTLEALINAKKENDDGGEAISFDTLIVADEGTAISGEQLYELFEKAKREKVTIASLASEIPNASVQVDVGAGPDVVEQAPRTAQKRGKKSADS